MGKRKTEQIPEDRKPEENNWEIEEAPASEVERGNLSADDAGASCAGSDADPERPLPGKDFRGIKMDALKVLGRLEDLHGSSLMIIAQLLIEIASTKIDPEIRKDKVIAHWALADDHATFIFDDGSKVRIAI